MAARGARRGALRACACLGLLSGAAGLPARPAAAPPSAARAPRAPAGPRGDNIGHRATSCRQRVHRVRATPQRVLPRVSAGARAEARGTICAWRDTSCRSCSSSFPAIGAPKASTTTFARSFRDSAGVYLARLPFKKKAGGLSKEVYFFDELAEDRALSLQKKGAWLEFYPRCLEERAVSTDMTPSYLRNTWSAGKIAEYYGDLKSKPVFVVLLREPVGRAQSHFNQMEELGTGLLPKGLTFSGFVTRYLQNGYDTEKKLMWCGQYAKQLRVWFQRFHSSQFWICPMKYHVDPHRFGIVPDLTSTFVRWRIWAFRVASLCRGCT
ncbi:unnamed protein product [Prorocentrum cordatum]|uniref:Sulfotransferase n=1 Tax=Prorocentrum cordatum TaxID=2364126 RepID=A0ABN9PQ89_9DINO|nr:unnamed protein product [Polarella glacialis]